MAAKPPEGPSEFIGRVIQGRYRLISPIAGGGMGSIYLAEQVGSGGRVAIKILRQERSQEEKVVKRFMREAQICSVLKHPNTISVYSYGQDESTKAFYLVMEYLEGQTLFRYVKDQKRLSPAISIQIALQILAALSVAHEKGILHRDLKPGNIMVIEREGRVPLVKILDFGLAKIFNPGSLIPTQRLTTLTISGEMIGTPHYMAPEQVRGEPLAVATDLYAVAVILYFMVVGRRPFEGKKDMQVAVAQLNQPFPKNDVLPPALQKVIAKASKKNLRDRFQRTIEFSQALRNILSENAPSIPTRAASLFSSLPVPQNPSAAITKKTTPLEPTETGEKAPTFLQNKVANTIEPPLSTDKTLTSLEPISSEEN